MIFFNCMRHFDTLMATYGSQGYCQRLGVSRNISDYQLDLFPLYVVYFFCIFLYIFQQIKGQIHIVTYIYNIGS